VRRVLFSREWLPRHAVVALAVAVMCWLGEWQWGRSQLPGHARSFFYAFQWWIFAGIAVYGWWRSMRDVAREQQARAGLAAHAAAQHTAAYADPAPAAGVPEAGLNGEPSALGVTAAEDDEEVVAYNRYLAWLNDNPRR
jgi:hypothetical protein